MKMNTLLPYSQYDSNTFQLQLPLNLGTKIDICDPVVTFREVLKGVNLKKYLVKSKKETRGRDGYRLEILLKIVLFANMIQVRSTRKIESLCKNDIRFMWLAEGEQPSHMTICNFINNYLVDNIENISNDIVEFIIQKEGLDISTVFIDGTKLEAFPNRYSWVWKKACITSRNRKFKQITELLKEINESAVIPLDTYFATEEEYQIEELEKYLAKLNEIKEAETIEFVYGTGKRKHPLQRYYEKLKEITDKLKEYATKIEKCGEHRNSYSKTDEDATFMRMKTDYMGNTALLPAYNWQLAVSNEYILFGLTSQSASDNTCFIPLMEKYRKIFGEYPKYPVADAGYGNLETYRYCENNNIEMYMKYPLWKRETHDKKFHEDIFRSVNFNKDEEGNIICPNNRKFIKLNETAIAGNIDKRTVERYQCESCEGCPFKEKCHKGKGNRIININETLTVYHKKVIENLASPLGIELRKQRSAQAEGAFGVIKQDYNYRRITRVSLKKVNTELYLIIIGFNLAKYHNRKYRLDYLPC